MKIQDIELDEVFKEDFDNGVLLTHPNGRKELLLYKPDGTRILYDFGKYVMSLKINKVMTSAFDVFYINGDSVDYSSANLGMVIPNGTLRTIPLNKVFSIKRLRHFLNNIKEGTVPIGKRLDTKCMEWDGYKKKEYGSIHLTKHDEFSAHRWSLCFTYGCLDLPTEIQVCHKCDNPPCVNPGHLFLGTNKDNVDDKVKKALAKKKILT